MSVLASPRRDIQGCKSHNPLQLGGLKAMWAQRHKFAFIPDRHRWQQRGRAAPLLHVFGQGMIMTGAASPEFQDQLTDFLPKMRVWALALTRNSTVAEDLVQEVAMKVLTASDSFIPR